MRVQAHEFIYEEKRNLHYLKHHYLFIYGAIATFILTLLTSLPLRYHPSSLIPHP